MTLDSLNFTELPSQTSVEATQLVEVSSITSFPQEAVNNTPIEFRVDPSDNFINLAETYIHVRFKIRRADGTDISIDNFTTTINNLAQTMWRNVELFISDEPITRDINTYPWISYVHQLTHTPAVQRDGVMSAGFFHKDDNPNFWEESTITGGTLERQTRVLETKGGPLDVYSQVMFDFVPPSKLLPGQTELFLRFVPAMPGLCLASSTAESLTISILAAKLYITKVKLLPTALTFHNKVLASRGYSYDIDRYQSFTKAVAKSDQNIEWHLSLEKMPKRLFVFQVDQSAYNGNQKLNIFDFGMFGMSSIQIFANDLSLPANVAAKVDSQLSAVFYQASKAINNPEAWNVTLSEFSRGYFIYAVDLTPDLSANASYKSQDRKGSITIKVDYKAPLKQPVVIFCVTETRCKMLIDNNRKARWA